MGVGTVDAMVEATNGHKISINETGLTGKPVMAELRLIHQHTTVIEMAAASGREYISAVESNPLITTTYGIGEMIRAALDLGVKQFIIGIGGVRS